MRSVSTVSEDVIRRARLGVAGKSTDNDSPYERIYEDASRLVRERLKGSVSRAAGDSPIEKLFITALTAAIEYGDYPLTDVNVCSEHERRCEAKLSGYRSHQVVIFPQAIIGKHRVDFLIFTYQFGQTESGHTWRGLVVECDGHDFHERTKGQATKDKARDREISAHGYHVFRFTGTELWRDPMRCAREVIKWGLS